MKITETIKNPFDTAIYIKGQEFLEWDIRTRNVFGLDIKGSGDFEIDCLKIDDMLIAEANISKNIITLIDGTKVKGMVFKLYPLDCKGERVSHHFTSSSNSFRVVKKRGNV